MPPPRMPFDLGRHESAGYGVVTDAVPTHLLTAMGAWLASAEEQARDLVYDKDLPDAGRNGIPSTEVGDAIFIVGDLVLHPKVIHGSPANTSAVPQPNVIVQVGVAGLELVGERETVTGWPATCRPQPAASSS